MLYYQLCKLLIKSTHYLQLLNKPNEHKIHYHLKLIGAEI